MHSDDSLRSDDIVTLFEDSLKEQGLDSVEVTHQISPFDGADDFYIRKQVGRDEQLAYKSTLNFEDAYNTDAIQKRIVLESEYIAEEFKKELITLFEVGEKAIEVCPYDGGWSRCRNCGTKVETPRAEYLITDACELSDPQPAYRDIGYEVSTMTENQKTIFKLYLVGALREECNPDCPNSKYEFASKYNQKI